MSWEEGSSVSLHRVRSRYPGPAECGGPYPLYSSLDLSSPRGDNPHFQAFQSQLQRLLYHLGSVRYSDYFGRTGKTACCKTIMATPNPKIKGPGMLYVNSRIARKDILDEATYLKWYDEDHIPEICSTDMKDAFRYVDTDGSAPKPYLAFYPMPDLAYTQGEEFKQIRVKSDILPGSGICYDLADIDVRYYGLVEKTDRTERKTGEFQYRSGSTYLMQFALRTNSLLGHHSFGTWRRSIR